MSGWYVVKFIEENAVEAIPSNWLINFSKCWWPNYPSFAKSDLQNALKSRTPPEDTWCKHKIEVMSKQSYSKFSLASSMASKATSKSDIEQTDCLPSKRKRVPARKYSSSDESDNEFDNEYYNVPRLPKAPKENMDLVMNTTSECTSLTTASTSLIQQRPSEAHDVNAENVEVTNQSLSLAEDQNGSQNTVLHLLPLNPKFAEPSTSSQKSTDFQREVIRYMVTFTARLRQQNDKLNELLEKVEQLLNKDPVLVDNRNEEHDMLSCYPIKNQDELDSVELLIENADNFQKMAAQLSSIGGRSSAELIRRILSRILTDEFAAEFSWVGHKGKKPFCTLRTADLLKVTVRKATKKDNWSDRDIELAAAKWLAKASERLKVLNKKLENATNLAV